MIVCFVDIGGIDDHHCLEVIVCFVDIGGIGYHHCLEFQLFTPREAATIIRPHLLQQDWPDKRWPSVQDSLFLNLSPALIK